MTDLFREDSSSLNKDPFVFPGIFLYCEYVQSLLLRGKF